MMHRPLQTSCKLDAAVPLVLQVWNLTNCKLRSSLVGHTGYINTVTVSPDGSLCASGGKVRCFRTLPARAGCCMRKLRGQASGHSNPCIHVCLPLLLAAL